MEEFSINEQDFPVLPVLPMRSLVVFPNMVIHFDVSRESSLAAINDAMSGSQRIFMTAQKDSSVENPALEDLYQIGVIAKIRQISKDGEQTVRVIIEGSCRAAVISGVKAEGFLKAHITPLEADYDLSAEERIAFARAVKDAYKEYKSYIPKLPPDILYKINTCTDSEALIDLVCTNLLVDYHQKQRVLSLISLSERVRVLLNILEEEIQILRIEKEIQEKASQRIDENQKEYFLREKLQVIREELGDEDSPDAEADEYFYKIANLKAGDDIKQALSREAEKLSKMPFGSNEATVIRSYLDCCLEMPWGKYTKEKIDFAAVRATLEKEHYGLAKVKQSILEQLAVRKNSPNAKGQIICLVGPPGVGKTSIAVSVGKAINRKTARIALGGVRDEAEIRGHRRTYLGSMPGRIMAALKQTSSSNCLLILDEIDKLGNDYKGDPASALLEVLDSEQNHAFYDHYIDLPFDLSKVMFITTANDASAIPAPLLDRMKIIELYSYTRVEKFNIARRHLIPKQMKNCGLKASQFKLDDDALYCLIDFYTREAGVRSLERLISELMSKSLLEIFEEGKKSVKIRAKNLEKYLGPVKYLNYKLSAKDEIGFVNGLAWTSVGGEVLPIEAAVMNGTGKLELTGSLGDVMQESAKAAITCVRAHADEIGISSEFYKNRDIHIHAPEGAIPKDGPSAGITMATAVFSALSGRPVRRDVAMTGEITLRGSVLPIGGLKEKSIAAYKSGIKTVIIPRDNRRDLAEIEPEILQALDFIPVDSFDEVIDIAVCPLAEEKSASGYILKANEAADSFSDSVRR